MKSNLYNIHGSCGIKTRSNMDEKGKMEGELKRVGAFFNEMKHPQWNQNCVKVVQFFYSFHIEISFEMKGVRAVI